MSASGTASGAATGPYPGTFSEQGSYTQTGPGSSGTLSASFTINSGARTITGTKTGTANGICTVGPNIGGSVPYTARWQVTQGNALLATRATYTDHGTSSISWLVFSTLGQSNLQETFTSSQSKATVAKCELVLLNRIALPIPDIGCPA